MADLSLPVLPKPAPEDDAREFGDVTRIRQNIYTQVRDRASQLKPLANTNHELRLTQVDYDEPGDFSLKRQKEAILGSETLGRRLRGTWELHDAATGTLLDKRRSTIATVPYLTQRGTFILNGTEYSLGNQMRLRAGIFARRKDNGELESHFNFIPGKGLSHHVMLSPETGVFYLRLGQSKTPLLPVLRLLGVTDTQLRKAWGPQQFAANQLKDDPQALGKLAKRFLRQDPGEPESRRLALAERLGQMEFDPEITRRTLGTPFERLSGDVYLAASNKLRAINRGEQEPDNRDHLAFQQVYGPEDLLAERVGRHLSELRRHFWRASGKKTLQNFPPNVLTRGLHAAILSSGVAQAVEGINPAQLADQLYRVTRMGEGAMPSLDAVPDAARDVQPSHLNYLDLLATPESLKAGVDGRFAGRAKKGSDGRLYAPFIDAKTGQTVWKSPQDLADATVAFSKTQFDRGGYVPALVGENPQPVPRSQVQYIVPHFEEAFAPIVNLAPAKSAMAGNRVTMAGRMAAQALPLVKPETPWVRSGLRGRPEFSYEAEYGKQMGALRAEQPGTVIRVGPGEIVVRGDDGKEQTHELYHYHPNARKTMLHQTPVVKPGQRVLPGGLLARSNYTDEEGNAALGLNARVAYLIHRGNNFEDAYTVSEDFAQRLTSEHLYQHGVEDEDGLERGKKAFTSVFGGKLQRKVLDNFDDDGVIKPGTILQEGDPIVLAVKKQPTTYGLFNRKHAYADRSSYWEHPTTGEVVDVVHGKHGPVVSVRTLVPTQVGDKIVGRAADKGIIANIVPMDEMPRDKDGRPYDVLANPLGVLTRANPAQMTETMLGKIAEATGKPYVLTDFEDVEDLNEFARQELKKHGLSDKEDLFDRVRNKRLRGVPTGSRFFMKLHHTSASKGQARGTAAYDMEGSPAKGGETGCFIASQRVRTIQGMAKIGRICEKRQGLQVLTFHEGLGEWVYRPITDWFVYRAKIEDVLCVDVVGPCDSTVDDVRTKYYNRATLHPTKQHQMLLYDGRRVSAGDLQAGDLLTTYGPLPTADQQALMLGTLLGDGFASSSTAAFGFEHSVKQTAWSDWKRGVLAGLSPNWYDQDIPPAQQSPKSFSGARGKNKRSRFVYVSHPHISQPLRAMCYSGPDGMKVITPEWLAGLNGLSVAVWVIDDGCIVNVAKKKGRVKLKGAICTHGFTDACTTQLQAWLLQRYGDVAWVGGKNQLTTSVGLTQKLIEEVARYVPWQVIPKSKKFLIKCVREIQKTSPPQQLETTCKLGKVPLPVKRVRPYKAKPGVTEINVYDFTVAETHTYCAGPALVSNSKRISMQDVYALLSHGAQDVIRDAAVFRGQAHPQVWQRFMAGHGLAAPEVPPVYRKFVDDLRGSGVQVRKSQGRVHLYALTDKDVDELAGERNLANTETVDWKGQLKPQKGGLFDTTLTGGHGGKLWSAIKLHEPLPNPVMEEPIRKLLGLTEKKYLDVLAGREALGEHRGPQAIGHALASINIEREIERARAVIASGRKTSRDLAVKQLGYLRAAQQSGIHPKDWMLRRVPVLPPAIRPVGLLGGSGTTLVSDPNLLYRDLYDANQNLRDLSGQSSDLADERLAVYGAFKAVTGLGDPIQPKTQEKHAKGLLKTVFGDSPKRGMVQRKLLSSTTDLVGRAVISPDPNLNMDEVGIPEDRAWEAYKPFIVRRLVRSGVPQLRAVQLVKEQSKQARQALLDEMEARPVIINRAPVLHRYGIMAFQPRLTKGSTMRVSPTVISAFAGDFDGDAMQYHVPLSDDAVSAAREKLMPSRNLFSATNFRTHFLPSKEYLGGLYSASKPADSQKRPRVFDTVKDALAAYERGDIDVDHPVEIVNH